MTAHSEVAVEDLKEGDLVVCRSGGLRAQKPMMAVTACLGLEDD